MVVKHRGTGAYINIDLSSMLTALHGNCILAITAKFGEEAPFPSSQSKTEEGAFCVRQTHERKRVRRGGPVYRG